ncbi:DUF1648 domain-containing protein [Kitasatospora sp. NPDC048194]|uniref:DUF1648 domain-containing protein n=1 Tax=Kitasatospora sp. NPDC048194 TaxID=3364045 RepID=UPI003714359B
MGTGPATTPRPGAVRAGAAWAGAAWALGVLALLVTMPLVARDRLPDPVATHWNGSRPDGSMSVTSAALFPAGVWLALVLAAVVTRRYWGGSASGLPAALLAGGGVLLIGAQASIVHANLGRSHWQDADSANLWVAVVMALTALASALACLATRRPGSALAGAGPAAREPVMDLPDVERVVWLSWAANPALQLTAALLGLGAVGTAVASGTGLTDPHWMLLLPLAALALGIGVVSSVRARVTAKGLVVGFGPLGWPRRSWSPAEIESARAEQRTAAQAGGFGYRVNRLGTTVMLRSGGCLVVRTRAGAEFAVSIDDAERGAALLNALADRADAGRP